MLVSLSILKYQLNDANIPISAAVSAWFSTHYGLEVSYSKNWVFPSELLWYDRWNEILSLSPQYIEILTWNDYGESHYIGPLSSSHSDDGNSKWTNDMPHDGWLSMATPYIAAFKAGQKAISTPSEDQLIYWYRPATKTASCDSTDTCEKPWPSPSPNPNYFTGPPNGYETVEDSIFVVALLTSPGTVTVTSGSNTKDFNAQAGANAFSMDLGTGKQSFALKRGGATVLSDDSFKEVSDQCICGIYNYNAYVGTLPAGNSDALQAEGLQSFASGLSATCAPTPSLGTAPPGSGTTGQPSAASAVLSAGATSSQSNSVPQQTSAPTAALVAPSSVYPLDPIPTPPPSTSTTAAVGGRAGCIMTTEGQFGPANCMPKGCIWKGSGDTPSPCDTGK